MRENVRILGILNIVLGCLGAAAGVFVLVVFGGLAGLAGSVGADNDGAAAAPILAIVGICIALFVFILSVPSIIGGWGLLHLKGWARILMIVVSVFNLFHIPFGTAVGIFGLWVLFNDETRRLFETGGQVLIPPTLPYTPAITYPPQAPPSV